MLEVVLMGIQTLGTLLLITEELLKHFYLPFNRSNYTVLLKNLNQVNEPREPFLQRRCFQAENHSVLFFFLMSNRVLQAGCFE